jgi:hypothetical protein
MVTLAVVTFGLGLILSGIAVSHCCPARGASLIFGGVFAIGLLIAVHVLFGRTTGGASMAVRQHRRDDDGAPDYANYGLTGRARDRNNPNAPDCYSAEHGGDLKLNHGQARVGPGQERLEPGQHGAVVYHNNRPVIGAAYRAGGKK